MWGAIINTVIGLWLMFSPWVMGYPKQLADHHYAVAPVIVTFAITSLWEVNRSARFFNILCGLWLIVFTLIISPRSGIIWHNIVACVAVIAWSIPRGKIEGRYGGGWKSLFEENPEHIREAQSLPQDRA